MRKVQLTKGYHALIDDEDYNEVNKFRWHMVSAKANIFYAKTRTKGKGVFMHRLIMKCPGGLLVDHKNHNGLDNRKSNLRICSIKQNNRNQLPYGRSMYKGVSWHQTSKKWRAQIVENGKQKVLGYFVNEADAAAKYDQKAVELFGCFSYLNFPEVGDT